MRWFITIQLSTECESFLFLSRPLVCTTTNSELECVKPRWHKAHSLVGYDFAIWLGFCRCLFYWWIFYRLTTSTPISSILLTWEQFNYIVDLCYIDIDTVTNYLLVFWAFFCLSVNRFSVWLIRYLESIWLVVLQTTPNMYKAEKFADWMRFKNAPFYAQYTCNMIQWNQCIADSGLGRRFSWDL